jgi:hypothetical protein
MGDSIHHYVARVSFPKGARIRHHTAAYPTRAQALDAANEWANQNRIWGDEHSFIATCTGTRRGRAIHGATQFHKPTFAAETV